jgi:serine/threonine-protein kinase RsbW
MVVDIERKLGGAFHTVSADSRRAALRNEGCPFGRFAPPAACRFTSALVGGLGARASASGGRAGVSVSETLAGGDHQCLIALDIGGDEPGEGAHSYAWPRPEHGVAEAVEEPTRAGFSVDLSMQLPRDVLSVPVTRHMVRAAMRETGVVREDSDDVELAVTEACANVIDHSGPGDAYEVTFTLRSGVCHIRVIDVGRGFDHASLSSPRMADDQAEHGRGVALMHALVDQVHFESEPERGTVVHLVKSLRFDGGSPGARLASARRP